MRRRARAVVMIGAFLLSSVGVGVGVAVAQDKPADTMDILREKARTDKKLVVATALALTENEAKVFWPVYNAYQSDMVAHYDQVFKLIDDYAKVYASMTDEAATQLLGEFLSIQTNQIAILTAYASKFQKVLPAVKVARLYQIENKMRALVDYELARQIPLVK
jgi:hypothetical protein